MASNLKRGSKGPDVSKLQKVLNDHIAAYGQVTQFGANGKELAIDGIFGPQTEAWVKYYQSTRGLVADGIVGPKTKAALAEEWGLSL